MLFHNGVFVPLFSFFSPPAVFSRGFYIRSLPALGFQDFRFLPAAAFTRRGYSPSTLSSNIHPTIWSFGYTLLLVSLCSKPVLLPNPFTHTKFYVELYEERRYPMEQEMLGMPNPYPICGTTMKSCGILR